VCFFLDYLWKGSNTFIYIYLHYVYMEDESIAIGYLCCLGSFLGSLGFFLGFLSLFLCFLGSFKCHAMSRIED
jgi:hypothetical protein